MHTGHGGGLLGLSIFLHQGCTCVCQLRASSSSPAGGPAGAGAAEGERLQTSSISGAKTTAVAEGWLDVAHWAAWAACVVLRHQAFQADQPRLPKEGMYEALPRAIQLGGCPCMHGHSHWPLRPMARDCGAYRRALAYRMLAPCLAGCMGAALLLRPPLSSTTPAPPT